MFSRLSSRRKVDVRSHFNPTAINISNASEEFTEATGQQISDIYPEAHNELPELFKQLSEFTLDDDGTLKININRNFMEEASRMRVRKTVTTDEGTRLEEVPEEEKASTNTLKAPEKEIICID